ncbi:MAG: hypothetical protein D6741_09735 [Planctomycetota bacterium]|nr:MAG: hypothetical protein D6741_09735 [Planctomycetota bacterium]
MFRWFSTACLLVALGAATATAQTHDHSMHDHSMHQQGSAPASGQQGTASAEAAKQAAIDRLKIAVQGVCPVSGQRLGAHGTPVKAQVAGETIFLCCKGCFGGKISGENWAKIHSAMKAAQGVCPVMGKPLPANAQSVVIDGQTVFVCCPGCISKIKADPKLYLGKVYAAYDRTLKARERPSGQAPR